MTTILAAILFPGICRGLILHESFPVFNTETYDAKQSDQHNLEANLVSVRANLINIIYEREEELKRELSITCQTNYVLNILTATFYLTNSTTTLATACANIINSGDNDHQNTDIESSSSGSSSTSVERSACFDCQNDDHARIVPPRGYLASVVSQQERANHQCGTLKCPWTFSFPPGKVVNLTVIEAGSSGLQLKSSGESSSSSSCSQSLLSVKELRKNYPYCSGENRVNHLHLSLINSLEVSFSEDRLSDVNPQFLVYYEVLGCADLTPPMYSRMRRRGEVTTIDCPGTDIRWEVKCINGSWLDEKLIGTCPKFPGLVDPEIAPQKSESIFNTSIFNMPTGVLMALVISTAVILGVLIMTTGLVCLKRHQFEVKHKDDPNVYGAACSEFEFREMGAAGASLLHGKSPLMNGPKPRRPSADLLARDNTYAMQDMKMDARPLPSLPNATSSQDSWRRNDGGQGPVPYGVFPSNQVQNRVTVQFHRADNGADVMASGYPIPGGTYRGRYPPNQYPSTMHSGQMPQRYMGPGGTNTGRFDARSMAPQRRPSGYGNAARMPNSSNYDANQDDGSHLYFVLDGNAKDERNDLTMGGGMPTSTLPQPPPAHQQFPMAAGVNPRLPPPPAGGQIGMMTHRHQQSTGGGVDPRCTCDDHGAFKSSGSLNNQL
ncbi:hypothetical protein HELRODRAFT_193062 [Helobdella robusta]|uniref:CUB domain-containing protein n=1 Tax=Helobdella robusta TaxID=6412 RepID=T1FUL1_HELRO|nr:hypothetical protein HELRODRAFT_193062 [Helobdella robusta]ESN98032.1 hypothetical protein HELRODRAFT_193062 [Helobdella robusta]